MAAKAKRYFGTVRKLPSGRYQARYTGPDHRRYSATRETGAALTFETRGDAQAWLAIRHSEILRREWLPPATPKTVPVTLGQYADAWLGERELADRTRDHYRAILRDHIYPTFGTVPVRDLSPALIRTWHSSLATKTGPTMRAHSYGLLRTILNTAVADEVIAANPCRVRGAGQSKRVKQVQTASLAELEKLTAAMPDRLQLMVLLGAWCGLRFGELAELRRSDVDIKNGVLHVRRGVVWTRGDAGGIEAEVKVKGPKSDAGKRQVAIPPHLTPVVKAHLRGHAAVDRDGLLFASRTGGHLAPSSLYKVWGPARRKAGRPDLRFHDLRHTGAVLAASTGATLAELMARLGHSTPGAALRYQHAAKDRDRVIADAMSGLIIKV